MSTENLQEQLNEIQSARDDIQSTLESKGETVSSDIRTFATAVNNLGNINTVNGIGADENRNAQLDASNINVDDTAETTQTIKAVIEEANTEIAKRLTKTEAEPFINEVTFDNTTFTFTFKNYKGETQTFDLPLESTVKSGRYDDTTKALILVLQSDDEVSIPVNELCDVYTGIDGTKIKVTVNSNNEIEATIKEGTIAKTDLTSELQNEIDAKATTEYVDNVIAELPGQDELEAFGQNISNSLSSKVDKQDLIKEFEGIDISYSENQIYTATAINQMGDTWGTELNNLKEELESNIADNTTLINDNKTAVDTEIAGLKTADTTLQTNIDTKLDKTATDNILSDVGVTLAVAGQPNAFSLSFDGINPADGTATSKSVRFEAKNQELEFHANGSYNGKTITVLPEKIVFDPKTSGLTSTKVSAAIREVQGNVDALAESIGANTTAIASLPTTDYVDGEVAVVSTALDDYKTLNDGNVEGLQTAVANAGTIKSVNGVSPDDTGAVEIQGENIYWDKNTSATDTLSKTYLDGIPSLSLMYNSGDRRTYEEGTGYTDTYYGRHLVLSMYPEERTDGTIGYVEKRVSISKSGSKYKHSMTSTGTYNVLGTGSDAVSLGIVASSSSTPQVNIDVVPENLKYDNTNSGLTSTTFQNAIDELATDINSVSVPEYSIKEATTTAGYAKTYSLTKDGTEIGVKIDIPKDLVVSSGTVKEVTTANTPYSGAVKGDKYIDLVLNDSAEDHIYIPVKDLVDVYTGKTGSKVNVSINDANEISADIVSGSIEKTDLAQELQDEITNTTSKANSNATKINNLQVEVEDVGYDITRVTNKVSTLEANVESNADNIDIITTRVGGLETRISDVQSNVNENVTTLSTRLTNVESSTRTNATDISNLEVEVAKKANTTDLDSVENALSNRITSNASSIVVMGDRVTAVESRSTNNATNISTLSTRIGTAETDIREISGELATTSSTVVNHGNRLTTVENKTTTNTENIDSAFNRIKNVETQATRVETNLGTTTNRVSALEGVTADLDLSVTDLENYTEGLKIVPLLENSESYVDVDNFTPIQCVRLNTETGIEAEDLDRLKCLKLEWTFATGFGTCVHQYLDVVGENYYYSRINEGMDSTEFGSWLKLSKDYMTESEVNRKLSNAIENTDITYTVTNDGDYGFTYRSATGWYCSMNAGIDSTTSACNVTFNKDINGEVTIKYKTSSESGWDKLFVYIDGIEHDVISGESEGYYTIDFLAKGSAIRFEYTKDSSSSSGDDCAYFKIEFDDIKTMIANEVEAATSSGGGASSTMGTELFMNYDASAGVTTYLNESVENFQLIEIIYGNISEGTDTDIQQSIKVRPNSVANLFIEILDYDDELNLINDHRMNSLVNVYGSQITVSAWSNEIHAMEYADGGMDDQYHRGANDIAIFAVYGHGVAEDAGGGPVACFVGDTKVAVEGGYKNIADIQAGDKVYSLNQETGEKELKEVDKLVNHEVNRIYDFKVGKEDIKSSWSHPFHVAGKGKLNACEISAGYKLQTSAGEEVEIKKVRVENITETVYEIRVKDNNNYFVGDGEFLVYNEDVVINDKEDKDIKVEKK